MDYGTVRLLEDSANIKVSVYVFSRFLAIFAILLTYPFSLCYSGPSESWITLLRNR